MVSRSRTIVVAVLACLCAPISGQAQRSRAADSLLRRGMFERAESLYYAAARARPRDPDARFSLGMYLWGRGAWRIGAVLVEEARQFGMPRRAADYALSKIYADLGEYSKLPSLDPTLYSAGERAMIRWLADHPSKITSPDSTVLVAFARTTIDGYIGAVRLRVNGRPIVAQVWPRAFCGLRLSDTSLAASKLRTYPADSVGDRRIAAAVADSVGFGRMSATNVPLLVTTLRDGVQATICFGTLMRFAPTFDPKAGLMTLRLGGTVPPAVPPATQFPFYIGPDAIFSINQANGWVPLVLPEIAPMLRDRRWTIDTRRGVLILEP